MKRIFCLILASTFLSLTGCAAQYEAYASAMKAKYEADGKARTAEGLANQEKWKTLNSKADTDVGRAMLGAAVIVSELKGQMQPAAASGESIKPPRDLLDTTLALAQTLTGVARVGVEWKGITENGATRRAEIAGNVEMKRIDGSTQLGIVDTLAKNGGHNLTVIAGGDAAGGNQDKRDCSSKGGAGGAGASSGGGGNGAAAAGGTATTGSANAAAAGGAPSGIGGSGGIGGTAGGNCAP